MTNLLAGIGMKLLGPHADWFYSAVFHLLGLVIALIISSRVYFSPTSMRMFFTDATRRRRICWNGFITRCSRERDSSS